METLRTHWTAATKLLMYCVCDATHGGASVTAAWWMVSGINKSEIDQLDTQVFGDLRAVDNPILMQVAHGAYSYQRNQTPSPSVNGGTREGLAHEANTVVTGVVDDFKLQHGHHATSGKPKWCEISTSRFTDVKTGGGATC